MWQKVKMFYPPWLELFPLLLIVFALTYTHINYPDLPATVPTHFGANGLPDSWSAKSFVSVYLLPLLGLATCGLMLGLNWFVIMRPDDPRTVVNLLESEKDALGPKRLEALRTFTAQALWVINTEVAALIVFLAYGSIQVALSRQTGLGWGVWVFFGLIMASSLGMTVQTFRLATPPERKK